jgi:nicotinamidase-related amidase
MLLIDMQERLLPAMSEREAATESCAILLTAARQVGVPIVISEQYPKGLGRTLPRLADLAQANEILEKVEFSCFANPGLRARLTGTDRAQTVIVGIEAHVCVLQTALEMAADGRKVFVVADAVTSRKVESKAIALQRMAAAGVEVVTTEMVLFEWLRSAQAPEFRTVSRLIR